MEKAPTSVKTFALLGMLSGIAGWVIAFLIPGTIAFAPLAIALLFGLTAFLMARSKKVKCPGGYIAMGIAIIGIVVTLALQSKEAVVAVDEKFEQKTDESAQEAEEGMDIDDALDELE